MGFWNYIGLASKNDIERLQTQIQDINKLMNICIELDNKAMIKNNELETDIRNSFKSIEEKLDTINNDIEEEIEKIDRNDILRNQKNIEIMNEKSNEIQNKIIELNNSLNPIYSEIIDNGKSNSEKLIESNKSLNQLTKAFKENKKNVEAVNKDVAIVQQMMRVVWVNDIIDTLESKLPNKKVK